MSSLIKLLPENVANQIAAGEVVQRPSSVVKELLENSVDCGSKNIKLIIKHAGKTLIQVIDDGLGMNKDDLSLCYVRHATSKIRKSKDLFDLKTMGFRGEALSSIASVSHLSKLVFLFYSKKEGKLYSSVRVPVGYFLTFRENIENVFGTPLSWKF